MALRAEDVQHVLQRRLARFDSFGHSDAMKLLSAKVQLDRFAGNLVVGASKQKPAI